MKLIQRITRPYGLKARFVMSILTAAVISAAAFGLMYFIKDYLVVSHFDNPDVKSKIMNNKVTSLQDYVSDNKLSSTDLSSLKRWEKKQPLILLELYDEKDLVYSSYYHIDGVIEEYLNNKTELGDRNNIYVIEFADKTLSAVMYMDISYKAFILGSAIVFMLSIILFILLFVRNNREIINYVVNLGKDVQILEGGDLSYNVTIEGNDELTDLARSLNRMRESFKEQLLTEQELHSANSRLITEMSHDLRTPLTGLMLYTEILESGKYKNESELKEYLDKIHSKASMLKQLSDNLFEYAVDSRIARKNTSEDFETVMSQFADEITSELESAGFTVEKSLEWEKAKIIIDRNLLGRISGNVLSNIQKYAEKKATINIETVYTDEHCGLSFVNTRAPKREEESHGIGLGSVRSMMEHMNGICSVEQTEEAFETVLMFKRK